MSERVSLLAEFADAAGLIGAAQALRAAGLPARDAFTPLSLEPLDELLELKPSRLPLLMLIGALAAAALIFWVQWWTAVVDFPVDAGGRPFNSWQTFVISAFEVGALGVAVSGLVGLMVATGLPRLNHPLFAVEGFDRATQDRFFLEVAGERRSLHKLRGCLEDAGALRILEGKR